MKRIIARLAVGLVQVFAVATLTFFLIKAMPGNPQTQMVGELMQRGVSEVDAQRQAAALFGYNLDASPVQQFVDYMIGLSQGNLGISVTNSGQPVAMLIAQAVPWTVFIASTGLLLSFAIGAALGAISAYRRGRRLDRIITLGASLLNGIPQYLTAIVLFFLLAIVLPLFPAGGAYSSSTDPGFNLPFLLSVLYFGVLPILSIVISSFAGWVLTMKASTVGVLGEDYIMAARAMAIKDRTIIGSYVARNAMLPMFTVFGLALGAVFGGAVFVETVFNYPGLGRLFIDATSSRDAPLMMGCFLLLTTSVIIANVITDSLYSRLDPRIR
ncbi:ABC transporter permease [Microbacterium sp. BWT-B31]|uniref:ABC transporter permease n=1 Tax=Microbacterium sp. BWT-B31 TaxID=3232072 RepID=UPI0035281B0E